MPYELIWEPGGVRKRYWGFVTSDEFLQSTQKITGDPRFDGLHYVIEDFQDIEGHALDVRGLEGVVAQSIGASKVNSLIVVAVVTSDSRIMRLSDATKHFPYESSYETAVFLTLAQAREWCTRKTGSGISR